MLMEHVLLVSACINMYGSQNRRKVIAILLAVVYPLLPPIMSTSVGMICLLSFT